MLIKMHQDKAVAVLCEHNADATVLTSTKSDSVQNQKECLVGNASVYPNDVVIEKEFLEMNPVSIVIFKHNGWGILFYEKGRNAGNDIMVQSITRTYWGMHHFLRYWTWSYVGEPDPLVDTNHLADFGVLLPIIGIENTSGVFSIVRREWSAEMFGEYNFSEEARGQETVDTANDESSCDKQKNMIMDTAMILDAEWT
jgi:hypothetical protein